MRINISTFCSDIIESLFVKVTVTAANCGMVEA